MPLAKSVNKSSACKWPAILLAIGVIATPQCGAHAQNTDPFQAETGIWKSFDRYKEEQQQKLFSEMTGNADADAKRLATENAAPSDDEAARQAAETPAPPPPAPVAQQAVTQKDSAVALAPPERPLDLPVMPGLSEEARFSLPVTSTEDQIKPVAHIAHIDSEPDLQLPNQNWLDANQAAQRHAAGEDDDGDTPLNVRYASMPSLKRPSSSHKTTVAALKAPLVTQIPVQPKSQQQQAAAADPAACAAIDEYHKQQLEALRSDRHTLSDLQNAIKELGLSKELNFMAGGDSKMNTSAEVAGKSASP